MKKNSNRLKIRSISRKRRFILALIIILAVILLRIVSLNKKVKIENTEIDPELALAMEYGEFEPGSEKVDGTNNNVEFSAFFLKDINGDGYAERVKGTCKELTSQDTLYMDINIKTDGYLKNGKVEIQGQNFYFQTALPKDNELKNSYIGNNIKTIEFNSLVNGTQKLVTGMVRSGDYTYSSSKVSAIGNNTSNYSKTSIIVFTGVYVDSNEIEHEIRKEIPLTVDWYGETGASISATNLTYRDIENRIDEENGKITLDFSINTRETKERLLVEKNHTEGTIPQLNGYDPISVECTSSNVDFSYDETTRKFTIERIATVNEQGIITNGIGRNNSYGMRVVYPIEAYQDEEEKRINIEIPVETYYEGYNNPHDEFDNPYVSNIAKAKIYATYIEAEPARVYPPSKSITVGDYLYNPYYRYVVSKKKPIRIYNGASSEERDDIYKVRWGVYTGSENGAEKIVLKEGKNGENQKHDEFIKKNNTRDSMEELTTNRGIGFSGINRFLEDDGQIKIYDDETDELLATYTKSQANGYTESNYYRFETPVKHIRVEVEKATKDSNLSVISIKELDDTYITENYEREEFDELNYIISNLEVTIDDKALGTPITHQAHYEAPFSVATIGISNGTITTQTTEEHEKITINAAYNASSNQEGWVDGTFLVTIPKEVIDVKIHSVEINTDKVKILSYELVETENGRQIKINTQNIDRNPQGYEITIDADITPDPRTPTSTKKLDLYATNTEVGDYYYKDKDIYDVNDNLNKEENINHTTTTLKLVSPNSLILAQTASDFDEQGTTVISPQIADIKPKSIAIDNEESTVKVGLNLRNNYESSISDVKVIGKIPFEGNKYVISGRDLNSEFTTEMLSGGLDIPDELKDKITIYYSTEENPNNNLSDESNKWTLEENVTDWSQIKAYMIDFQEYTIEQGESFQFDYMLKIPYGLEFNKIAFSEVGAYFSIQTAEGKLPTKVEPTKLGFRLAEKYDLEITKYQKGLDKVIPGVTYNIHKAGEPEGATGVTKEDGKLKVMNLYAEEIYVIEEIKVPDEYELNTTNKIKFVGHVDMSNGQMSIQLLEGQLKGELRFEQIGNKCDMYISLEDEVKANLELIKYQTGTDTKLKNAIYKLTGKNYEDGRSITTNSEGIATLNGLSIGEEYTLKETRAPKGYYLNNDEIKFKIERDENGFKLNIISGNVKEKNISITNDIPCINIELEDDKIPTYDLVINKVSKGDNGGLAGVKFRLYYGKETLGTYESDENGNILIPGLYEYVQSRGIEQTFTLKEIYSPEGYSKIKDIEFHVEMENGQLVFKTEATTVPETSSEGRTVTIKVENPKSFKLTKIDGETQEVLPGAKFAIYNITDGEKNAPFAKDSKGNIVGTLENIDGQDYYLVETDERGEISANLPEGLYKAVEIVASDEKYDISKQKDFTYKFGIGASKGGTESGEDEGKVINLVNLESSNMKDRRQKDIVRKAFNDGGYIVYNSGSLIKVSDEGNIVFKKSTSGIIGIEELENENYIIVYSNGKVEEYDKGDNLLKSFVLETGISKIKLMHNGNLVTLGNSGLKCYDKEYKVIWSKNNTSTFLDISEDDNVYIFSGSKLISFNSNGELIKTQNISFSACEIAVTTYDNTEIVAFANNSFSYNINTYSENGLIGTTSNITQSNWGGLFSIAATSDGGFIGCGFAYGDISWENIETGQINTEYKKNISNSGADLVIIKYNAYGQVLWTKLYGNDRHHTGNAIAVSGSGYCWVLFRSDSTLYVTPTQSISGMEMNVGQGNSALSFSISSTFVPEQSEILSENYRKQYKITTDVEPVNNVKGGAISGEDLQPYETVKHGDNSILEIKMTPDRDYEILGITVNGEDVEFTPSDQGTYILPQFTNVTEDKHIVVKYCYKDNKITLKKVDSVTGEKLGKAKFKLQQTKDSSGGAASYSVELSLNANGEAVAQIPFGTYQITELEAPDGYILNEEPITIEFLAGGEHTFEIPNQKYAKILVHHYYYDLTTGQETDIKVADDESQEGKPGERYTTSPHLDLEYELLKDTNGEYVIPGNAVGEFDQNEVKVINYYYTDKQVPLIVHHYIEGTTTGVPLASGESAEDYRDYGKEGDPYTTEEKKQEELDERYEISQIPDNATGEYEPEEVEVTYFYKPRTVKITTEVKLHEETDELGETKNVKGGEITGEKETPYETVSFLENSIKEVKATPDEGYEVKRITVNDEEVSFIVNSDKSVSLEQFTEMREDKHIVVEFQRIQGRVFVRHYIEGTRKQVPAEAGGTVEDELKQGNIGAPFTTKETDEKDKAYKFISATGVLNGEFKEEDQEAIYYYNLKDTTLRIKYLEKGTNKVLAEEETSTGKVYDEYTTTPKDIENYTYVEDSGNTEGKLAVDETVVIYYYLQKTKAVVQHIDKNTGEILEESTEDGLVGDDFVTNSKNFDGYVLVEEPEEKTVPMEKEVITLKYYYVKISAGVLEKHIDIHSGEILANDSYTGNEGDPYDIPPREFEGYELVEEKLPDNNKGEMTVELQEVIYYYRYKTNVIVKHIDILTGKELAKQEELLGYVGDEYKTKEKEFKGYELVQEKYPENNEGNMEKETITVIYYYVHSSAGLVENHYDVTTGEKLAEETRYSGHEGDDYTTKEREFEGYTLVKEKYPTNAVGKMKKEEIRVDYYYVKKTKVITKYIDIETGKEIEKQEIIDGVIGQDYETRLKSIVGYKFLESTKNTTGKMTEETIEVIYYYARPEKIRNGKYIGNVPDTGKNDPPVYQIIGGILVMLGLITIVKSKKRKL